MRIPTQQMGAIIIAAACSAAVGPGRGGFAQGNDRNQGFKTVPRPHARFANRKNQGTIAIILQREFPWVLACLKKSTRS